jgi:tripartite-type tricarboxylate transporter receptor subunit TctC
MPKLHALLLQAAGVTLALTTFAAAQDYPTKPVRIVVPFPPGAFNDQVGRIIAAELSERLGKQFVVENRGGAGGIIGAEIVANAPKDGHTLLIVSLATAVNPWLYTLPFEPVKAFAPVSMIVTAPNVVAVYPGLPARSIKELIALAKQQPGALQYSSSGVGTFVHLSGELFKLAAGIDMLHVPFKGTAPAMIDVMAGNTKVTFGSTASTMPHLRSGKVRALGVGGRQRSPALPDVPTVIEAGLPGYEAANWIGLVAPAGTPTAIVERLHKEIVEIQNSPKARQQFDAAGAEIARMGVAEFGAFQASELAKWGKVVKETGIKAQ